MKDKDEYDGNDDIMAMICSSHNQICYWDLSDSLFVKSVLYIEQCR